MLRSLVGIVYSEYDETKAELIHYLIELRAEFECQCCPFLKADLSADFEVGLVGQQNDGNIDGAADFTDFLQILFSQKETLFIADRVNDDKGFGPFDLFFVLQLFAGL